MPDFVCEYTSLTYIFGRIAQYMPRSNYYRNNNKTQGGTLNTELKMDMTTTTQTAVPFSLITPAQQDDHPAREKIRNLDLEPIKYKLVKEHAWTLEKADAVEKLYKTYLLLFALHPDGMYVPTHDIDEMWHSHILDTRKYMEDCRDIFGYYLHHYPYLGLMGDEDAQKAEEQFAATRRLFITVGGIDPVPHMAADCGGGCGGGGSCSGGSCSGGGDSGGGGDTGGGHDHGDGGAGHIPIISSCSSTSNNTGISKKTPLRDDWKKKKDKKKTPANDAEQKPEQKKKPFWKKIIGLAGRNNASTSLPTLDLWQRSVTPLRSGKKDRPGRAELLNLAATHLPKNATKH